jgi:hypothetical protein
MNDEDYFQDVLDREGDYIDVNHFVDEYEEDEGIYEGLETNF